MFPPYLVNIPEAVQHVV